MIELYGFRTPYKIALPSFAGSTIIPAVVPWSPLSEVKVTDLEFDDLEHVCAESEGFAII